MSKSMPRSFRSPQWPDQIRLRSAALPEAAGARRRTKWSTVLGLALGLYGIATSGCAVIDVKAEGHILSRHGWVLLPVQNLGETHMAGERVEELLTTLLRIHQDVELAPYSAATTFPKESSSTAAKDAKDSAGELDLDERQHYERVLAWARDHKFAYGIGGSVQEWRYRSGTEGEPAVGLTLRILDLATGRTVFTAAGASPTPGRGTLSGATQELLRAMLKKLPLDPETPAAPSK